MLDIEVFDALNTGIQIDNGRKPSFRLKLLE